MNSAQLSISSNRSYLKQRWIRCRYPKRRSLDASGLSSAKFLFFCQIFHRASRSSGLKKTVRKSTLWVVWKNKRMRQVKKTYPQARGSSWPRTRMVAPSWSVTSRLTSRTWKSPTWSPWEKCFLVANTSYWRTGNAPASAAPEERNRLALSFRWTRSWTKRTQDWGSCSAYLQGKKTKTKRMTKRRL